MQYLIISFLIGTIILINTSCSYCLYNTNFKKIKKIVLDSPDPYGELTRTIRQQLRFNNIKVINKLIKDNNLIIIKLKHEYINQKTRSIFQDGKTAEYLIVMEVSAQLISPNNETYPIIVIIYRYFFDNPLDALAQDAEKKVIINEMRIAASQQLIHKIYKIYTLDINKKTVLSKNSNKRPSLFHNKSPDKLMKLGNNNFND